MRNPNSLDFNYFQQENVQKNLVQIVDLIKEHLLEKYPIIVQDISSTVAAKWIIDIDKSQQSILDISQIIGIPPTIIKLPRKWLTDLTISKQGILYNILKCYIKFINQNEIRSISEQTDNLKKKAYIENLISNIFDCLEKKNIINLPKFSFSNNFPENEKSKITQLIYKIKGSISDYEHSTYCIYNNNNSSTKESRIVAKSNNLVHIHYLNYPDSYDAFITENIESFENPEKIEDKNKPYPISKKWIDDSVKFNEWMNENDYIVNPLKRELVEEESDKKANQEKKNKIDNEPAPIENSNIVNSGPQENENQDKIAFLNNNQGSVPEVTPVQINKQIKPGPKIKNDDTKPITNGRFLNISQSIEDGSINSNTINANTTESNNVNNESTANNTSEYNDVTNNESTTDNNGENPNINTNNESTTNNNITTNNDITTEIKKENNDNSMSVDPSTSIPLDQNKNPSENENSKEKESEPEPKKEEEDHSLDNVEIDDGSIRDIQSIINSDKAKEYIAKQTHEIIIPSYAAWFSFSDIHETEKKALPEFFNNKNKSKTPTIYKEYRDFIINTYRLNPSEYLTVTACRRNLTGDVCAIIRVHAFLEQWGLINYQVNPDIIPNHMTPHLAGNYRLNMNTSLNQASISNLNTINNSQVNLHPLPQPQQTQIKNLNNSIKNELNSNVHKNVYHSTAGENNVIKLQNGNLITYCQSCQKEFTKYQYVNHKIRNYVICSNCFYEGKYPMTMQSGDFFKTINKNYQKDLKDTENEWTDQETLLLLEGLDMYDDDWSKVADHVKTKTQDQCILRFLQLPIEDPFLDISQKDLGGLQYQDDPLNQTENPVMSIVAFLTSVVNPGVASAAANAALVELGKEIDKKDVQVEKDSLDKKATPPEIKKDNKTVTVDEPPKSEEDGVKNQAVDAMKVDEDKTIITANAPTPASSNLMKTESMISEANTTMTDATLPTIDTKLPEKPLADTSENKDETQEQEIVSKQALQKAAAAALAAAAAKAKVLAVYEEREIRHLVNELIELQLKKLEMKMNQFDKLEIVLEAERNELKKKQKELYAEQVALKKQMLSQNIEYKPLLAVSNQELNSTENKDQMIIDTLTTNGQTGPEASAPAQTPQKNFISI
ncbi:hypothetical protein BCR36DRAFT_354265 [Piromyces finnis]|uniref:SWIRM-domain-containing protein n=1 Tax=Piromyces finnis TaxID=1754191 RepID=A0A1Y1V7D3_9FUNG|nr:hypothetical protein BCR36DRAFT_354265 [Piromyces finnis]|eukprot:ORX49036.1 hypothetical protein BCR36DRAFT_354265 [Piromyces finnis]